MEAQVDLNMDAEYQKFLEVHQPQLHVIGFPENLIFQLYEKLNPEEVFDAGNNFIFGSDHKNEKRLVLCSRKDISKHSDVFLVDHAWTNDGGCLAEEQLKKSPQLVERMRNIFALKEEDTEYTDSGVVVSDVCSCSSESAKVALSDSKNCLIDTILELNSDYAKKERTKDSDEEDTNPEYTLEEFKDAMNACMPNTSGTELSEEYILKMYENFVEQGGKEGGVAMTSVYNWVDNRADDFIYVDVAIGPNVKKDEIECKLMPSYWELAVVGECVLISGELYDIVVPDESWWCIETPGVFCMALQKGGDKEIIWPELIKGENQLTPKEIQEFTWKKDLENKAKIKEVLDEMWYHNQTYQVSTEDGSKSNPVWYVMDEVGNAISHDGLRPNFKCAPFLYVFKGVAYTLIWPIADIKQGEQITRNYVQKLSSSEGHLQVEARRLSMTADRLLPFDVPKSFFDAFNDLALNETTSEKPHLQFTVPQIAEVKEDQRPKSIHSNCFSKEILSFLEEKLNLKISSVPDNASIIFVPSINAKIVKGLDSNQWINHFRGEEKILEKMLLCDLLRKQYGTTTWFPTTYDLQSQLPQLMADHFNGEYGQYWILKASNSFRLGVKPIVTSDLTRISRMAEVGDIVASQLSVGQLYKNKTFSLTYPVIITSLKPLELYVYMTPYIRFAKKEYDPLAALDEYDTSSLITEVPCGFVASQDENDFRAFTRFVETQMRKLNRWTSPDSEMLRIIGNLFINCADMLSDVGNAKSFAIYGADFIFSQDFKPLLIGIDSVPVFANKDVLLDIMSLICNGNICEHSRKFTKIKLI